MIIWSIGIAGRRLKALIFMIIQQFYDNFMTFRLIMLIAQVTNYFTDPP